MKMTNGQKQSAAKKTATILAKQGMTTDQIFASIPDCPKIWRRKVASEAFRTQNWESKTRQYVG